MIEHLWQSTLFAAVVWIATLALRRNGARVRYWLWTAASVKFLVPFSWLVGLGSRFEWRTAPAIAQPAATFVIEEVFSPSMLAAPAAVAQESILVPWLLLGAWVAGSLAVLFWWSRQWIPVRSAVRGATPLTLPADYDTRGLTLMSSSSTFEPGVVGVLRPVLLLPEGLVERLTPAQLNALLAHERCHVKHHDNLVAAIHMAVEAIFWFHPLVWWIERRMIDERERACDEAVLGAGSRPADYAEGILTVCRWSLGSPVMCVSGITGSDLRTRIETIMANRTGRRLSLQAQLLLAGVATLVLGGPIGIGLLDVSAQSQDESRPRFDVASIRRTPETTGPGADFSAMPGGRLHVRNNPVLNLITNAYGVARVRTLGGPEWIRADRYDMEAKSERNPSESEMMLMLQGLLEERFKLKVHRETREGPVYILSVARGGPKLSPSRDGGCVDLPNGSVRPPEEKRPGCGNNWLNGRGANIAWIATRIDMSEVAGALANLTGRPVIDRTGVSGFFDINLELPRLAPEPVSDPSAAAGTGSMFTVVREQLGLTLEPGRGPLEYLVIDSIERPSDN